MSVTFAGVPGAASTRHTTGCVVLLAEVDRERGAAVDDRAGGRQRLPAVQVAQRDVVRLGAGNALAGHVVLEDGLRGAFAAAERAAGDRQVRHDQVDRVGGEAGGELAEHVADQLVVAAGVLRRGRPRPAPRRVTA